MYLGEVHPRCLMMALARTPPLLSALFGRSVTRREGVLARNYTDNDFPAVSKKFRSNAMILILKFLESRANSKLVLKNPRPFERWIVSINYREN